MTNTQKLKGKIEKLNKVMAIILSINIILFVCLILRGYQIITLDGFDRILLVIFLSVIGLVPIILVFVGICYLIYKPYVEKYTEMLENNTYNKIIQISILSIILKVVIILFLISKLSAISFQFYIKESIITEIIYIILVATRIFMVFKLKNLLNNTLNREVKNGRNTKIKR